MTDEQFWDLIERSRIGAQAEDGEQQAQNLAALLAQLEAAEIVAFNSLWSKHYWEAFRWDLWAVAYIINGGCSDDAFMDFRGWLIAQGQRFFEAALQAPENAADGLSAGDYAGNEPILYAAGQAYKQKTGRDMDDDAPRAHWSTLPSKPAGAAWRDEDLPRLHPELCARFNC